MKQIALAAALAGALLAAPAHAADDITEANHCLDSNTNQQSTGQSTRCWIFERQEFDITPARRKIERSRTERLAGLRG